MMLFQYWYRYNRASDVMLFGIIVVSGIILTLIYVFTNNNNNNKSARAITSQ